MVKKVQRKPAKPQSAGLKGKGKATAKVAKPSSKRAKPTVKQPAPKKSGPKKPAVVQVIPPPHPPPVFRGEKKRQYDALMSLRARFMSQMKFHSDEALDAVKNSSGELASMSTHMADAGSDNFLHDMELNMMTSEGNVIELIDEAIERLVEGDYGQCLECGCPINPKRLEAIPYAQYCIRCKTARERRGEAGFSENG